MRTLIAGFAAICALACAAESPARQEARRLLFAGRYEQAAERYRALLAADPGWGDGYDGLVRALLAAKKTPEAYQVYADALKRAPNTAGGQTAAGRALFRGGEFQRAMGAFAAGLKLDPAYAPAACGLARVGAVMSRFETAQRMAALAHQLASDDPEAILLWADTLKDHAERLRALEAALAVYDRDSEPAKRLAEQVAVEKALGDRRLRVLESPYQRYDLKLDRLSATPAEFSLTHLPKGFTVSVQLNAGPALRLLLDTHPRGILITRQAAAKARLESLGGEQSLAREIHLGGLIFSNYPLSVADPQGLEVQHDGYLGSDVFEQFLISIDFPTAVLTLEPFAGETSPPEVRAADAVRPLAPGFTEFFRLPKRMLLPVSVKGQVPRAFSVDSTFPTDIITDVRASSGAAPIVDGGKQAELAFGGLPPRRAPVVGMNLRENNDAAGTEISGFLGLPALIHLKLTIDYRNGAIAFRD